MNKTIKEVKTRAALIHAINRAIHRHAGDVAEIEIKTRHVIDRSWRGPSITIRSRSDRKRTMLELHAAGTTSVYIAIDVNAARAIDGGSYVPEAFTPTLESVLINLFRRGGQMNVSQATAQVQSEHAAWSTTHVKTGILALVRARVLRAEHSDGITRFMWNSPDADAGRMEDYTIDSNRIIRYRGGPCLVVISGSSGTPDELALSICKFLNNREAQR